MLQKVNLKKLIEVIERIKLCLEHIDRERFIAAPDCGLGLLNRDLAKAKLNESLSSSSKHLNISL